MKSCGFSLQKGGVGKTSLAGNTGYIASKRLKTLLIDSDPQGSLSSWLVEESAKWELADVLQGKASISEASVELRENLFILPTFGIGGELKSYSETSLEKEPFIFQDLNREAEKKGFNLVIYDLSPGLGRLERCVLMACSEVVTPLTPEYLSIDGIEIFNSFLRQIEKGFRVKVHHEKLVLNAINRSFRRHDIYVSQVKGLNGYRIFEISQTSKIPESQIIHQFLMEYDPENKVIPELDKLTGSLTNDS